LVLSGSATEQATLGTTLPQYKLKYVAIDGTEGAPQSGVVSTEVKVDGKPVEAKYAPGCATKNCEISREWTLTASNYTPGSHTLEVLATDGVGLVTTKTLSFTIAKDEIAPSLTTTGAFFSGPEGWLMQKSYAAEAIAKDPKGYGLKSLALKIDGSTVKSTTVNCPNGGCSASIATTVNVAGYKGGAHIGEVIATDGAGNTTTKKWTINVDPSGSVPASEAASTLEAVEGTEPKTQALAPTDEVVPAGEQAEGNDPGMESLGGGEFATTGIPIEATVSTGAQGAMVIETEEQDFEITPVSGGGSSPSSIVEGVSVVTPSTHSGTDTVTRPKYDGLMQFQDIREPSSPENYSWEVSLQPGETMKPLEEGQAAGVFFEEEVLMMLITAMPAHDVLGHGVPTHLSVTGPNIVTLTVEHHAGSFVYPVTSGPAFEVGYSTVEVIKPPPTGEVRGDPTTGYQAVQFVGAPEVGGPEGEGAEASGARPPHRNVKYVECSLAEIEVPLIGLDLGGCELWQRNMKVHFHYNGFTAWWNEKQVHPNCTEAYSASQVSQALEYCDWRGPNFQPYGAGYHISAQLALNLTVTVPLIGYSKQNFVQATAYLYGDGYASPLHQTNAICNPLSSC